MTPTRKPDTSLSGFFKPANLMKLAVGYLTMNALGATAARDSWSAPAPSPAFNCQPVFNGSHLLRGFQAPDTRGVISAVPSNPFDKGDEQSIASLNRFLDSVFTYNAEKCGIACAPVASQTSNKTLATQAGIINTTTGEAFNATISVENADGETARCIAPAPALGCTTKPC